MLAGLAIFSEVVGCEASVLGNAGEHPRAQLLAVVKGKDHIRPPLARQGTMGSGLALNDPTFPEERGQYT